MSGDSRPESERATICPNAFRPTCPTCNVEMWLVGIDRLPGNIVSDNMHFQCTVCLANQTINTSSVRT